MLTSVIIRKPLSAGSLLLCGYLGLVTLLSKTVLNLQIKCNNSEYKDGVMNMHTAPMDKAGW